MPEGEGWVDSPAKVIAPPESGVPVVGVSGDVLFAVSNDGTVVVDKLPAAKPKRRKRVSEGA